MQLVAVVLGLQHAVDGGVIDVDFGVFGVHVIDGARQRAILLGGVGRGSAQAEEKGLPRSVFLRSGAAGVWTLLDPQAGKLDVGLRTVTTVGKLLW